MTIDGVSNPIELVASASKQNVPPIHDVDIRLLRIFKSVVECGGLSAAEFSLGVGRSAISKHLSDLETRLKVRLCERGRSGFSITPYGESVYRATIELLDALDQFRTQISAAKGVLTGPVSLCLMDDLYLEPNNPAATAIKVFAQRSDQITLNVSTAGPEDAEDAVFSRRSNVAITCSNKALSGLSYKPLTVHRTSIFVSVDHTLANSADKGRLVSDFSNLDVVARAYVQSDDTTAGLGWRSTAVSRDLESTVQLILSGHYVGVLPDHIAEPWLISGRMVRLNGHASVETQVYVVFRTKSKSLPIVQAMVQDIISSYGAETKAQALEKLRSVNAGDDLGLGRFGGGQLKMSGGAHA